MPASAAAPASPPILTPTPTPKSVKPLAATVARDDLLAALRWAVAGFQSKPQIPVLSGVRLHGGHGGLAVTVFDYETSAEQTILAPGAKGTCLVAARQLASIVSTLPKGSDIILRSDWERLEGVCGDVEIRMPLLPLAEWPNPPEPGERFATLTGEQMTHLARPAAAAGRDDALPVLTGVRIEADGGKIVTAATDRYRLAVAEVEADWPEDRRILVPARTWSRLGTVFAKEPTVEFRQGDAMRGADTLTVSAGGRTLCTRLLDGTFPKYRSLMSVEETAALDIERDQVLLAVRQAAAATARTSPIVFHLTRPNRHITSQHPTMRPDSSDVVLTAKIKGKFTGEALDIGFNPLYVTAGLHAFGSERVRFTFASATKPMTLHDPDGPGDFTYLLMPVRMAS